jgi:ketosteroid isomerase-like protein
VALSWGQLVRPRTQQWFSGFRGPIGYDMRDVRVTAGDDIAFAHLLYRVSGTLESGDELGMWNRATFCFRKVDGAWRIVHEHDSVPFDPATGMASTDLEPGPDRDDRGGQR